jgi:hypothetical protein
MRRKIMTLMRRRKMMNMGMKNRSLTGKRMVSIMTLLGLKGCPLEKTGSSSSLSLLMTKR